MDVAVRPVGLDDEPPPRNALVAILWAAMVGLLMWGVIGLAIWGFVRLVVAITVSLWP